jgi:hypothetical protein
MDSVVLRCLLAALHDFAKHTTGRPAGMVLNPRTAAQARREAQARRQYQPAGTLLGVRLEEDETVPPDAVLFTDREGGIVSYLTLTISDIETPGELTSEPMEHVGSVIERALAAIHARIAAARRRGVA